MALFSSFPGASSFHFSSFHFLLSRVRFPASQSKSNLQENPMFALSNDRFSRCTFAFADGRRCRMLRFEHHLQYCHHHALKEAQALAVEKLGQDMTCSFAGRHFSSCDLAAALSRLLDATASGRIKPNTASTLAHLGRALLQINHLAENEYSPSNDDAWRQRIRDSVNRTSTTRNRGASPLPPLLSQHSLPPAPPALAWPESASAPVTPLE
jgi:hypothetical protein